MDSKLIINRLIWIDAKVNNPENRKYIHYLKKKYNLQIDAYETSYDGINALSYIQFESIFVITSGTIYPEFLNYMLREYVNLRVIPFSIIFTSSAFQFIHNHKNDIISKLYNKTFFNRGGVVDTFAQVDSFINEIYTLLNNFKTKNRYEGIFTKNYSGLIVFENVFYKLNLPPFFRDIITNKHIDYSELNNFTKFFLQNFCTPNIEKLLKPLILFKEVPEVIISKYWARVYTHESPFYSVMNICLMKGLYKEYEVYIKLLYRGLACNSYQAKFNTTLTRGTKLELTEINYLKSIAGTGQIIYNKSFLSFSLNRQRSIEFQDNTMRESVIEPNQLEQSIEQMPLIQPIQQMPLIQPIQQMPLIQPIQQMPLMQPIQQMPLMQPIQQMRLMQPIQQIIQPLEIRPEKTRELRREIKVIKNESLSVLIEVSNINDYEKNNYLISNAFLKDISCYSKEEEVLVFPFTGFEVTNWETSFFQMKDGKETKGTIFYFKFSEKYFQEIRKQYRI